MSTQTEPAYWTIAYRKPRANHFHRVTDWSGTWRQAFDLASVVAREHPELQVYYVPTLAAEQDPVNAGHEDNGNILVDNGRRDIAKWPRIRIAETGKLSNVLPEAKQRVRHAEVHDHELGEIEAYLYSNYQAASVYRVGKIDEHVIEIVGYDHAGFTLDAIIDRLASGLIFAREVV